MTRLRLFALAVTLIVTALAGCGPSAQREATANRIVYGLTLSPSGFDPHIHQSSEMGIVLRQVYDTLLYRDPFNGGAFVPGLAESWAVSADQTVYTFTLKEGVVFHDGTPFNAAAVGANLNRIAAPETRSQYALALLGPYAGFEIIDDRTIAIRLSEPFSPLLDALSQFYLGMASPTALNAFSIERYQFNQIGTGPYRFVEYIPDQRLILRRNPDYAWGPPFYSAPESGIIEEIEFRFYTDPATRMAALEQGVVQVMGELQPADARALTGDSQIQVLTVPIPGQPDQFMFNTLKFPTDNLSFRQALLTGTNRQALVDVVYQGFSPPATGALTAGVQFKTNAGAQMYGFDSQQARALIAALGYVDADNNGFWDADGGDLTVKVIVPPWGEYRQMVQLLQDQWRAIGVKLATVSVPDFPTLLARVTEGDYNLVAFTTYGVDPAFLRQYFVTGAPRNWTGFGSAELDALIADAVRQLDPAIRQERYAVVQQVVMDQVLILPLRQRINLNGVSARVSNLRFDVYGWYPILYNASYQGNG